MAVLDFQQALRGDLRRAAAALVAGLVVLAALGAALATNASLGLKPAPDEYNVAAWEVRNLPGKWLFLAGELLRGAPSDAEQDATLRRFFELNAEIEALARDVSQSGTSEQNSRLAMLLDERDGIENQVEATLESRLTTVIKDEGITRNFLTDIVWPPVDAEFTEAPRALATSPRDRIELLGSNLLREDLTLAEAEAIEEEIALEQDLSALSFSTGGIGAYPTIIDYPDSYERALEVIAHEWMHNYLFFRPLGFNYYTSNDLRTINESVADLVGRELADAVASRWPLEASEPPAAPATAPSSDLDVGEELRKLRGEVDALLEDGKVDEAEALMEERRLELAEQGHYIRKINQAYFAYLNLYAGEDGSPAATNPIGPKVDSLRDLSPSLAAFVATVGNVTGVEALDEALLEAERRAG